MMNHYHKSTGDKNRDQTIKEKNALSGNDENRSNDGIDKYGPKKNNEILKELNSVDINELECPLH